MRRFGGRPGNLPGKKSLLRKFMDSLSLMARDGQSHQESDTTEMVIYRLAR